MVASFGCLSQEVVDEVLGFLHDDKETLKACSLTCRSMVQGAQRGLFSTIFVAPVIEHWERQPGVLTQDNLLDMMKAMPHVASYTKSLHITCSHHHSRSHNKKLAKVLSSFGRLTKLAFGLCTTGSYPTKMAGSELISSVQNLLTLPTLQHVEFIDVPVGLLPYSTTVKHLVIRFNNRTLQSSQSIHFQPHFAGKKPIILESLHMDSDLRIQCAIDRVVGCGVLDISRLVRLHIDIERLEPYGEHLHINELLKLCGSSLQVFKFTPSQHTNELDEEFCSEDDFQEFVDLGPLKSLRIFAVSLQVQHWEGDPMDDDNEHDIWTPFAWLQKVLKTAQNLNALEEIVIKIVHSNSDAFKLLPKAFNGYFGWTIFGPLLARQFPRLCKLKLLLQADYMPALREILDLGHPLAVVFVQTGVLEIKELDSEGE